jgi:glutaminase A
MAPLEPELEPPATLKSPSKEGPAALATLSSPDDGNLAFLKASVKAPQGEPLKSQHVLKFLEREIGFSPTTDPRIQVQAELLQEHEFVNNVRAKEILSSSLMRKAFKRDVCIRDFPKFVATCEVIYEECIPNQNGGVATYIPQLARQNPDLWGVCMCSVDGQRMNIGDCDVPFCVQSTSKPITYCVALETKGEAMVHEHVGREPSGRNFNDRSLMVRDGGRKNSIPHNPYINAGAIMTSSLVKMEVSEWDRFTYMMTVWQKLSGGTKPSFQNDTFMGERSTASRNFCLAYMMEEENAFPSGTDLRKTLEAYFSWCSIEVTAQSMACVAATLANGGICPITNERVFTNATVTSCLSLMMSCGMYDYSGQFAFEIGFPAKSGVSGVLCIVIPRVCGFATFSPRLDKLGNSVRGIDFCQRLARRYPFHVFSLEGDWEKLDEGGDDPLSPRSRMKKRSSTSKLDDIAASSGVSGPSARAAFQAALNKQQEDKKKKGEQNQQNAKKTLGHIFGTDPQVLLQNAFKGWQKMVVDSKALKRKFGMKWLKRKGSKDKPSDKYVSTQSKEEMEEEKQQGEDSNFLWEATTSLWWAARWGDEQRIRQLAANGMDVTITDYDQRSALHVAASEGHERVVHLLIGLHADINARDLHGNTPVDDAAREQRHLVKRQLQHAARQQKEKSLLFSLGNHLEPSMFNYFSGKSVVGDDGVDRVLKTTLTEVLDSCGINVDSDPRFKFLEDFPQAFTSAHLTKFAKQHNIISLALKGRLVVPNFPLLCEHLEILFSEMIDSIQEEDPSNKCQDEALSFMTTDGQRLDLGRNEQDLCAGDLIGIVIFAMSTELLGREMVMQHVAAEASGTNSDASILNGDQLPYNPFMWNGMLTLISLLEEKCGNTIQIIEACWAKLCNHMSEQIKHDETWMKGDIAKNDHRVRVLVHTSFDLKKFPNKVHWEKVMEIFFRLRAIKCSTQDIANIGAVLANRGHHPLTLEKVFQQDTVKGTLSLLYSAGCNAQSGEFSFRMGIPAKSNSQGVVLLILPSLMGLCVLSPEVNDNEVSLGASKFCEMFGSRFNCHILSGSASAAAKRNPVLYNMTNDIELCQQLLFAAEKGELTTLSALQQLGFSLDSADYDYRSAAHLAACQNYIKVLNYLKKKGANMHAKDRWGATPYDEAKRCGHHKAACILQQAPSRPLPRGRATSDGRVDSVTSLPSVDCENLSDCESVLSSASKSSKCSANPRPPSKDSKSSPNARRRNNRLVGLKEA